MKFAHRLEVVNNRVREFRVPRSGKLVSLSVDPTGPRCQNQISRTVRFQPWALGFERHALLTASAGPINSSPEPLGCPNLRRRCWLRRSPVNLSAPNLVALSLAFRLPSVCPAPTLQATNDEFARALSTAWPCCRPSIVHPAHSCLPSQLSLMFYSLPDSTRYGTLWETEIIE